MFDLHYLIDFHHLNCLLFNSNSNRGINKNEEEVVQNKIKKERKKRCEGPGGQVGRKQVASVWSHYQSVLIKNKKFN